MDPKQMSPREMLGLASAYWSSCALHAGVKSKILQELAKAPATPNDLAAHLGLSQRGVGMLCQALCSLGVLAKDGQNYAPSPGLERCFLPDDPANFLDVILHMADMTADWITLAERVASGKPVARRPRDHSEASPAGREHFYRAMRDLARQLAPGMAARLGLRSGMRVLDLGGGPGVYGLTMADEEPGLQVTVFDLPGARPFFEEEAARHPGADRVEFKAGTFHKDPVGGPYDLVWLSQVLHGEGPEACEKLIYTAASALGPGGRLVVQEFVVDPECQGHPYPALFGLNMLVNTPQGKAYSAGEIIGFMNLAGLVDGVALGPTQEGGPASLVQAIKPG